MSEKSGYTEKMLTEHIKKYGIFIISYVCHMLDKFGYKIEASYREKTSIWDASIIITKDAEDKNSPKTEFYFYNTFIEIFCVDRDDDPIEFDKMIVEDDRYIFQKMESVINGRLIMICGMMEGKTTKQIYEENPGMFERITQKEQKVDN